MRALRIIALIAAAAPVAAAPGAADWSSLETAAAQIARTVAPSLVTIQAFTPNANAGPLLLPSDPEAISFSDAPWRITIGAGVVADADGWVLTASPIVEGGARVEVLDNAGNSVRVESIYYDRLTKVAALRVDTEELRSPPADLSTIAAPRLGAWAVAVSPGLTRAAEPFVSVGVIGGLALPLADRLEPGKPPTRTRDMLWLNAPLPPDGQGCPVFTLDGSFLGVSYPTPDDMPLPGGCVIPASSVRPVFERLRAGGTVRRAWLGVSLMDAPPAVAPDGGAFVNGVNPEGPAAAGGVAPGDVIVAATPGTGKRVAIGGTSDLIGAIEWLPEGANLELEVVRGGEKLAISITLGRFPDAGDAPTTPSDPKALLGASYRDLSAEECAQFGIESGVAVESLVPTGFARLFGILPGDVIVRANGKPTATSAALEEIVSALGQGDQLLLELRRGGPDGTLAYLVGGRL